MPSMKYARIQKLRRMPFFTVEDVSDDFGITRPSARVLCNRYTREGILIRLKKNLYVLDQNWQSFTRDDYLRLANFIQVPSYVSFATALSFHEITTQVQRDYYESASLKRSVEFSAGGVVFNFHKLKKEYYFGFIKRDNLFIANREKAFVDAAYLCSLGRYKLDFSALDVSKLDRKRLKDILAIYPPQTTRVVAQICKI